ncbi:MAG: CpsB/CapC family capsule biosynthesis tyrosine phosphatase [Burkholderiales bacterium]
MIDLHCHLLPGIDDGAPDEATALAMARIAVADGIATAACTPHVYPGLFDNDTAGIAAKVGALKRRLEEEGVALALTTGADAHLTPELLSRLRAGTVPTLGGGRYFLLEPPHTVAPPRFAESVFAFVNAGYVPVITHPERLTWIRKHYDVFAALVRSGAWTQVTAGSLTGRFGPAARQVAERMLDDGLVHVLGTDAHSLRHRPPLLAEGREAAEKRVGREEAQRLVLDRPQAVLDDRPPAEVVAVPALRDGGWKASRRGVLARLIGRR